jgi:hypothetical protein
MKKLIFGVFLPILILVFNGLSFAYGAPQSKANHPSNFQGSNPSQFTNSDAAIDAPIEKGRLGYLEIKITEIEIEEYELASPKRTEASTAIIAQLICALSLICFFSAVKKRLAASADFSDLSSLRKHLVFQVFRQ